MNNEKGVSAGLNPDVEKETENTLEQSTGDSGWVIRAGLWGSVLWLVFLVAYISNSTGWFNLFNAPMDTLGSFLEGAFAPLAFLWFVLGYFTQQKELSQNTEAIKLQHQEMQKT